MTHWQLHPPQIRRKTLLTQRRHDCWGLPSHRGGTTVRPSSQMSYCRPLGTRSRYPETHTRRPHERHTTLTVTIWNSCIIFTLTAGSFPSALQCRGTINHPTCYINQDMTGNIFKSSQTTNIWCGNPAVLCQRTNRNSRRKRQNNRTAMWPCRVHLKQGANWFLGKVPLTIWRGQKEGTCYDLRHHRQSVSCKPWLLSQNIIFYPPHR